jgi:hypothetical protein
VRWLLIFAAACAAARPATVATSLPATDPMSEAAERLEALATIAKIDLDEGKTCDELADDLGHEILAHEQSFDRIVALNQALVLPSEDVTSRIAIAAEGLDQRAWERCWGTSSIRLVRARVDGVFHTVGRPLSLEEVYTMLRFLDEVGNVFEAHGRDCDGALVELEGIAADPITERVKALRRSGRRPSQLEFELLKYAGQRVAVLSITCSRNAAFEGIFARLMQPG